MFDIGWSELLVIAVVAIVVVGPKDLPRLMRTFGHYAGKLRRAAVGLPAPVRGRDARDRDGGGARRRSRACADETSSIDLKASIDKPIMLPKPPPRCAAGGDKWKGRRGC